MSRIHDVLARLPVRAFVWIPEKGQVANVFLGQHGCVPYPVGPQTPARVQALNEELGVSTAQAEAMLIGSTIGWHAPAVGEALAGFGAIR